MNVSAVIFLRFCVFFGSLLPAIVLSQQSDVSEVKLQQIAARYDNYAVLPWVKNVNAEPNAALLEVPLGGQPATAHSKVWLHFRSSKPHGGDQLIEYTHVNSLPIYGCMGTAWEKCRIASAQSAKLLQQIGKCLQDPQLNQYFVSKDGRRFICLNRLVPEVKAGGSDGNIAVLAGIAARWKPRHNPLLLNDLFATAPYWTPSDRELSAIGCARITSAVAAYSTSDYFKEIRDSGEPTELSTPRLVWAWTYLAKLQKPYTCGLANYLIDHVDVPMGVLPDGTALVRGLRTVIRIRVIDGSTDAPAHLVRRVPAREYMERMVAAGQPDCIDPKGKQPCHWVGNQRSGTEENYARRWFEGFDRAVRRIYFTNFKD